MSTTAVVTWTACQQHHDEARRFGVHALDGAGSHTKLHVPINLWQSRCLAGACNSREQGQLTERHLPHLKLCTWLGASLARLFLPVRRPFTMTKCSDATPLGSTGCCRPALSVGTRIGHAPSRVIHAHDSLHAELWTMTCNCGWCLLLGLAAEYHATQLQACRSALRHRCYLSPLSLLSPPCGEPRPGRLM